MLIALITSLVLIEPLLLLAISTASFTQMRIRRAKAFCAFRGTTRFSKRNHRRETVLLSLPEEILVEIVKLLEWRDILRTRQASRRLRAISKSLTVWRCVVESVPPQLLWLERPIKTYAAEELETLFLRRQRAEAGYEAIANGFPPYWRTIEVEDPPERPTMVIVPGGRWLLVPNARGSIFYYDLNAKERYPHILIPEQHANCLTMLSIDVDFNSPYLRFNLALHVHYLRGPGNRIEVWQVVLVLDKHYQGIGLRAALLASFSQEPPGFCDSLSLLGDNLAYTAMYDAHSETYTLVVNWKSVQGSSYPKRIFHPASRFCARLLPGNILVSGSGRTVVFMPIDSLPVVTAMSITLWHIPKATHTVLLMRADDVSLSSPTIYEGSIRFIVNVSNTIHGITLTPDPNCGGYGYQVQTVGLLELSKSPDHMPMSLSEDFLILWSRNRGLMMQRISWSNPSASCFPLVQVDRVAPFELRPGCCHQLDMASGRVLAQRRNRIMVLDLSLL